MCWLLVVAASTEVEDGVDALWGEGNTPPLVGIAYIPHTSLTQYPLKYSLGKIYGAIYGQNPEKSGENPVAQARNHKFTYFYL